METFTSVNPRFIGCVFHESGIAWDTNAIRFNMTDNERGTYFLHKGRRFFISELLQENKEAGYDL